MREKERGGRGSLCVECFDQPCVTWVIYLMHTHTQYAHVLYLYDFSMNTAALPNARHREFACVAFLVVSFPTKAYINPQIIRTLLAYVLYLARQLLCPTMTISSVFIFVFSFKNSSYNMLCVELSSHSFKTLGCVERSGCYFCGSLLELLVV